MFHIYHLENGLKLFHEGNKCKSTPTGVAATSFGVNLYLGVATKPVFGVSDKARLKQVSSATKTS